MSARHVANKGEPKTPIIQSHSSGSIPFADLGVVEEERGLFASFSSSLPLGPSSPLKLSGKTGGSRRSAASSAALVAGLLCLLLLPALGRPLPDAMSDYILFRYLCYTQGPSGSEGLPVFLMVRRCTPKNDQCLLSKALRRSAKAIRFQFCLATIILSI